VIINNKSDKLSDKLRIFYYDNCFYIINKESEKEIKEIIEKKERISNELQIMNARRYVKEFTKEENEEFEKKQKEYIEQLEKLEAFIRIRF